jgi:hypothetical protein
MALEKFPGKFQCHSGQAGDSAWRRISRRLKWRREPESTKDQEFWIPADAKMTTNRTSIDLSEFCDRTLSG